MKYLENLTQYNQLIFPHFYVEMSQQ